MDKTIPLIAQHVSWLSVDPVLGCPASCSYCYLHPLQLLKQKPHITLSPEEVYEHILEHPYLKKDVFGRDVQQFPICFGNYTDMCRTPSNKAYLLELLTLHRSKLPDTPVCVVTKGLLDEPFLEKVNGLNIKIIFVISLSFLPPEYEEGVPKSAERLQNFSRIAAYENIGGLHYWRPITRLGTPDLNAAEAQVKALIAAKTPATIVVGLTFGKDLKEYWETTPSNPLHAHFQAELQAGAKHAILDDDLQGSLIQMASRYQHPLFLNTTCAISYLLRQIEYSSIFRGPYRPKLCLPSNCPPEQRQRCAAHRELNMVPSDALLHKLAVYLNLPDDALSYDPALDVISVQAVLTDAEERFLSHAAGFLVQAQQVKQTLEWSIATNRDAQPLSSRRK